MNRTVDKSIQMRERAARVIPGVAQTLAKGPTQFVQGVAPVFLQSGDGCRVTDVDGNEYIDYCMGIGPISLGYAYPAVDEAIRKQMADGISFSLVHPVEVEVAELLTDVIPCAEMVKFGKNGCDVTSAAVRLARAATGRDHVITCGYHGWHDWSIAVTDRNRGIPEAVQALSIACAYNDIESLREAFDMFNDDIACVIMEPIIFAPPDDGFLESVRELTHEKGALLIFDEIWTGFRFALGGAQELTGVTPDLSTCSKAMANGMPVAALVGKREYMDLFTDEVFYYITCGGESLSLAAAAATIREMQMHNVIDHLQTQGQKLIDSYNVAAAEFGLTDVTGCMGYPCRSMVTFQAQGDVSPLALKTFVQQELIKAGILWSGMHVVSYSHTDMDVEQTKAAHRIALQRLRDVLDSDNFESHLEGPALVPVFSRMSNVEWHKERLDRS